MSTITLRDAALLSNQVNYQSLIESSNNTHLDSYDDYRKVTVPGGGGGTAIYGLYRYVPLCRVWFSSSLLQDRVYKSERVGLE